MRAWVMGLLALTLTGSHLETTPANVRNADDSRSIDVTGYDATVTHGEDDWRVAILCDPIKFRLSLRLADADSLDRSYPARMTVDPEALIQPLPSYNGDMQYRGQLIRYVQCGPYSVRLTGDFYNANIQGQLGAYPSFVTADIFSDNRMIVPNDGRSHVSIGECERDNRLSPDCPSDWAVRMDVNHDAKRETVLVRERYSSTGFLGGDRAVGRQSGERRYEVNASLSMWEHARDARKAQAKGTP